MSLEQPWVSLCVVSWNSAADLPTCLNALLDSVPQSSRDLIVVDNASRDNSVEVARAVSSQLQILPQSRNLGLGAAANRAASVARGEMLVFINPDVTLLPGALAVLQEFFHTHPEAGCAGPQLLNPDGSLQPSCRSFPTLLTGFFRYTWLGRLFPKNRYTREYLLSDFDHEQVREVEWLSGACLAVRRSAWEQVGGFDESFFMFCEDTDLCYRLRRAGWKVYYVPQARAYHKRGASTNQAVARMTLAWHRSMLRFYRKHYRSHYSLPARFLAVTGICLRCLAALAKTAVFATWGRLTHFAKTLRAPA